MKTKIVPVDGFGKNQKVKFISIRYNWDLNQTFYSDTDPSKIGHGQPKELRTEWGEAEQFGGKMHTANITVKAFYN